MDYKQIVRELNYKCRYSTQATVDVVQILYKIKKTGLYENEKKKLQKVMNHYAIEYDNMIVIKP